MLTVGPLVCAKLAVAKAEIRKQKAERRREPRHSFKAFFIKSFFVLSSSSGQNPRADGHSVVVSIRAERSEIAIGDELAVSRGEMEKTRAKLSGSGSLNRVRFLNDTTALIREYHLRFALAAYQLLSR